MGWIKKVLDRLGKALAVQTSGSIGWIFSEFDNCLQVASTVLQIGRGADNGTSSGPVYSHDISHLIELFDEPPEMLWDRASNELSVHGQIDWENAWITFFQRPFDVDRPQNILNLDGGVRKWKPPINL